MAVTTCPVRVSYPTIFTPRAMKPGDDPKYGIVLMFDKKNKDHMACIKELHVEAQEVFNVKWPDPETAPRIPIVGQDKSCIKDGDKCLNNQGIPIKEKNLEYEGHYIIRAGSTFRPPVVGRDMQEIIESRSVYAGCFCKVNLNAYAYDTKGNKGVTFGLNGVQFWEKGKRIGGGPPNVGSMFEKAEGSDEPSAYENDDPFADAKTPLGDDVPF